MCNLYNIKATGAEIAAFYQARDDWRRELTIEKDYVAPGRPGYVVREEDGRRVLDVMSWGFPFQGR